MDQRTDKRFAMLIDTDNISPRQIETILAEIRKRGVPMIRRAYGDWSKLSKDWKDALLPNAIIPVQQYAYTPGKNATDFALVIDAMDILHRDLVEGFAIVSSDSDFTPLALRLREAGKDVIGIGENKAPAPFREACNPFVEIGPGTDSPTEKASEPAPKPTLSKAPAPADNAPETRKLIARKIDQVKAQSANGLCSLKALAAIVQNEKIALASHPGIERYLLANPSFFVIKKEGTKVSVDHK